MSYLLDTDVIISHLRKKKMINLDYLQFGASISVITLGELFAGAHKSLHPKRNLEITANFINDFELEIIGVDQLTVETYALMRSGLEKQGQRLEDFDLLIAATAQTHDLELVTNNKKHFSRIKGLGVL